MFTKLAAGLALAIVGTAALAIPAQAAAPIDQPAGQPFEVACSTGQHALVTLPAAGSAAVGSVLGSDADLVPYRFDYRWTDRHGKVLSESEDRVGSGPLPRSTITCELAPTAYPDGTSLSFTETAVLVR